MLELKEKGVITYHRPNSIISEQYREIRTNLKFAAMDQEIKTLAITSAESGVGKSVTAANLAISMAQRGDKVLLVDADLRKPTLHSVFKLTNQTGLTEILMEKATWGEAVQPSSVDGLEVMTTGTMVPNWMELYGSHIMEDWQALIRDEYDIVIFDCPPVLEVSVARVLAHRCDGVILVLKNGKTKREKAIEAKRSLEFARANVIGVILNQK